MVALLAFSPYPWPNKPLEAASEKNAALVVSETPFIGPKLPNPPPLMIQAGVLYKTNPPSEPAPPPPPKPVKPKPKYYVTAALVSSDIVLPDDLSTGDKVGDGECVTFAKAYVGVGGTWGYGGRNLSLNSGPAIGTKENPVVILFYGHVAVIIGMQVDGGLILIESNWHLNHRVLMGRIVYIGDPSIRGYHDFSKP